MFTQEELEEVKDYIANVEDNSKIYLGCDSIKYKKGKTWYAKYTSVIVIHIGGNKGCKVFGYSERERDYDPKADKPRMRLMNEAYKVVALYMELAEELEDFETEVHLDINPDKKYGSSVVISQALGYVMGMTGIKAKPKPEAYAASYTADWFVRRPDSELKMKVNQGKKH